MYPPDGPLLPRAHVHLAARDVGLERALELLAHAYLLVHALQPPVLLRLRRRQLERLRHREGLLPDLAVRREPLRHVAKEHLALALRALVLEPALRVPQLEMSARARRRARAEGRRARSPRA